MKRKRLNQKNPTKFPIPLFKEPYCSLLRKQIFIKIFTNILCLLFSFKTYALKETQLPHSIPDSTTHSITYFAGGCFWCTESDLEKINGVIEVVSGYSGGDEPSPTYELVSSGRTKYIETVKVIFNPQIIDYKTLLQKFILTIDVTNPNGQFADKGPQYRSVVFYTNESEKKIIDNIFLNLKNTKLFNEPVVTEILKFKNFYPAEGYHQNYYKTNPLKYKFYRTGSGRDRKLKSLWKNFKFKNEGHLSKSSVDINIISDDKSKGVNKKMNSSWDNFKKPSKAELQKILTDEQFKVTQNDSTERPFENKYNSNKESGIYVDIVSGEPLFSSKDKYDSGTGWPSFSKPIIDKFIVTKRDFKLILPRTEVRSKHGDSHLGHVFNDGPAPTGMRYCMNSAAMKFIPKTRMIEEGYEEYLKYVE